MAKDNHMNTTEAELKAVAKAAGASLARAGHNVPHTAVLNALAAALNRRDWNKLKASLAKTPGAELQAAVMSQLPELVNAQAQPANRKVHVYCCQNCDFETQAVNELNEPTDLWERVSPGEPTPAGECPECGALCHGEDREVSAEVRAKFWTDDHVCEAEFDARPFLMQASDDELLAIIEIDYRGDYATDAIAEFMGTLDAGVAEGMAYIGTVQKARLNVDLGFECMIVNPEDFLRWMDLHRTAALARHLCSVAGVVLQRHKEAEAKGDWGWDFFDGHDDPQETSEGLFKTKEAAILDAYQKLSLLEKAARREI